MDDFINEKLKTFLKNKKVFNKAEWRLPEIFGTSLLKRF